MHHVCASSLQFNNHSYMQPRFNMSKLNISSQVSFDRVDLKRNDTYNTFVGTKSFISRQEVNFRPIKYSQLVGGFVGSKSQLGTSNRISCQIWDIIFCKLMSFVSSSNMKSALALKHSEYSYEYVFDSVYGDISDHKFPADNDTPSNVTEFHTPINSEKHIKLSSTTVPSNPIPEHQKKAEAAGKDIEHCKQSYADVTKTSKQTKIKKQNLNNEHITYPKESGKNKGKMAPIREINSFSKRKKQKFWRKKRKNRTDYNADKTHKDHKQEINNFDRSEKRTSDTNLNNVVKAKKNIRSSNMNKNVSCDVKYNSDAKMKEFDFLTDVENYFEPVIAVFPNTLQHSRNQVKEQTSTSKVEDMVLPKRPSFNHGVQLNTYKSGRTHLDSSDSDDFVIFAIAEADGLSECSSENDECDSFSDNMDEVWNAQEEEQDDAEEIDNQVTEDLKKINERWQKMYSCFPGKAKEPKKVHFASDEKLKKVHSIIAWDFAYRAARIGPWEQMARDQERFMHRILELEHIISPVLSVEHRHYVHQRTMKHNSVDAFGKAHTGLCCQYEEEAKNIVN